MISLIFSPTAERDLESIADTISSNNPLRAVHFVREIRKHCQKITEMPRSYPKRDDIALGLRMAVHGNYLIFYRETDEGLRIERILHGARNYPSLF